MVSNKQLAKCLLVDLGTLITGFIVGYGIGTLGSKVKTHFILKTK